MITITTKNAPKQLVEKINAFIKNKRITTWDIDNENDYILNLGIDIFFILIQKISSFYKPKHLIHMAIVMPQKNIMRLNDAVT